LTVNPNFLSGQDPIIGGPPPEKSPGVPKQAQFVGPAASYSDGDQVDIRLVGGDGKNIEVTGFAKVRPTGAAPPPGEPNPFFVTSRGGEYFFVPSVSTLKSWASDGGRDPDIIGNTFYYIANIGTSWCLFRNASNLSPGPRTTSVSLVALI